jgi:hypothetical protein
MEPPTEPVIAGLPAAAPLPPPPSFALNTASEVSGPFARTRYHFTTGLRAGDIAAIRADDGHVLFSYRSFASVVGIVATLVSAIVFVAGLAAVMFLLAEQSPVRAAGVVILTLVFASLIGLLVPRITVTLYDDAQPALTVSQRTIFPTACYTIATPNGVTLAEVRRTLFSRLGRNRWTISQQGRFVGDAAEESLRGALVRKALGKFNRRFETNFRLEHGGVPAGRIIRRAGSADAIDVLEIHSDALDRRVAVALATLILGREP